MIGLPPPASGRPKAPFACAASGSERVFLRPYYFNISRSLALWAKGEARPFGELRGSDTPADKVRRSPLGPSGPKGQFSVDWHAQFSACSTIALSVNFWKTLQMTGWCLLSKIFEKAYRRLGVKQNLLYRF